MALSHSANWHPFKRLPLALTLIMGTVIASSSVTHTPALAEDDQILAEISRLATQSAEQKQRIQALEAEVSALTKKIEQLSKSKADQEGLKPKETLEDALKKMPPSDLRKSLPPVSPEEPKKKPAPQPENHAQKNKPDSGDSEMHSFEEFLEQGEKMLRHFFGTVKEMRRDIEENRA